MKYYHYIDGNGEQRGPVASEELNRLHREQHIHDNTLVLEEGRNQWKPYSQGVSPGPVLFPAPPPLINEITPATPPPIGVEPPPPISLKPVPAADQKSFYTAFFLCLFLGIFGAHRFYLGVENGLFQLLTLGGCGIWTLVDLVRLLTNDFPDGRGCKFQNPNPKLTWPIAGAVVILLVIAGSTENENSAVTPQKENPPPSVPSRPVSSWGSPQERALVGTYESVTPPYVLRLSYSGGVSMQNLESGSRYDGKWSIEDGSLVTVWKQNSSRTTYTINSDGSFKSSHGILFVKTQ